MYVHRHTHTHACMHMYTQTHVGMHTCKCIYLHTQAHTYTHAYIDTHTCISWTTRYLYPGETATFPILFHFGKHWLPFTILISTLTPVSRPAVLKMLAERYAYRCGYENNLGANLRSATCYLGSRRCDLLLYKWRSHLPQRFIIGSKTWHLVGSQQAAAFAIYLLSYANRTWRQSCLHYQCLWDLQMQLPWGFVSGAGMEAASEVCDTLT